MAMAAIRSVYTITGRINTGSTVAERLLTNWPEQARRFVKVMPTEYRRVLNEQLAAAETHTVATSANVEVAARG